jgi:hypothetical protein
MNRHLLIMLLIFISGCASDFGFQGQSQNIVPISEFKFKSGISGNVPPGLCQIKQLKSEREGHGVVFFSNCNPHTNNKSLVTLTYLNLGQTQSAGSFSKDKFNNSLASFQKYDDLNPMVDEKSLRILKVKENYIFMAIYYVPKGRNLPNFRAKAYLNSILLSVKVPKSPSSVKAKIYESVDPVLRPKKRPSFKVPENLSLDKANFRNRVNSIPRPKKRPLIF